jgi:hypothetical protein
VELEPVVEVVEVDGSRKNAAVVRDAVGRKDVFADLIRMAIALDCEVVTLDVRLGQPGAVCPDPSLKLGVGRAVGFHKRQKRIRIQPKGVAGHRIVTLGKRRIAVGQFPSHFKTHFLPKPGKVEGAKGTGNAGTDEGYVFGHGRECVGCAKPISIIFFPAKTGTGWEFKSGSEKTTESRGRWAGSQHGF